MINQCLTGFSEEKNRSQIYGDKLLNRQHRSLPTLGYLPVSETVSTGTSDQSFQELQSASEQNPEAEKSKPQERRKQKKGVSMQLRPCIFAKKQLTIAALFLKLWSISNFLYSWNCLPQSSYWNAICGKISRHLNCECNFNLY